MFGLNLVPHLISVQWYLESFALSYVQYLKNEKEPFQEAVEELSNLPLQLVPTDMLRVVERTVYVICAKAFQLISRFWFFMPLCNFVEI